MPLSYTQLLLLLLCCQANSTYPQSLVSDGHLPCSAIPDLWVGLSKAIMSKQKHLCLQEFSRYTHN